MAADRPIRVGGWLLGLAAGTLSALAVDAELFPAVRPIVMGGTLLGFGLTTEVAALAGRRKSKVGPVLERAIVDDGRIAVEPLPGIVVVPNTVDSRFGRQVKTTETDHPNPSRPERDGSRPAIGRILIGTIFLERAGRSWSDSEIAATLRSVETVCRWIEREAKRWQAPVELAMVQGYPVVSLLEPAEDAVELVIADQAYERSLMAKGELERILGSLTKGTADLGYRNFPDFVAKGLAAAAPAPIFWAVFPREAGRSFAVRDHEATVDGANLAICYAADTNFPEPLRGGRPKVDSATIAHEVMHLFGATDKYGPTLDRFAKGDVTRFEIMRMSERRLKNLRVDPATAREIGWLG